MSYLKSFVAPVGATCSTERPSHHTLTVCTSVGGPPPMVYRFILPSPTEEVEDFCVLEWHKKEGQSYQAGDLLVEVETQKAIIEVRATAAGALRRVLCQPGDWHPFGAAIALVSD